MKENSTSNNLTLTEKGYKEIAYSCTDSNLGSEPSYADSSLNFFGVSSGIIYTNLDTTTFENC
ncbi:hypothetical protein [Terrisporobacter petrolearius]|uniref:hypothetical protein n=1 Tax=Terrisporobacter petrolearius TaxID=1460447 RepID=UPI0031CC90DF